MGDASATTITGLCCYPVKACRAVALQQAVVTPSGLLWDRQWLVVQGDSAAGKFLTQRQVPKLALVEVELQPPALLTGEPAEVHPDAALVLRAPGMDELRVPIIAQEGHQRKLVPAEVWGWTGQAADEGEAPAAWLTAYLGRPARLLRFAGSPGASGSAREDATRRECDEGYAPQGTEVAFQDGYPVLLASEASLVELNRRLALPAPLPMNRFRPNIVVGGDGLSAWDEDAWEELKLGDTAFENVKPCDRCRVTTTSQETAEVGEEPLETLHVIRSGLALGWTEPKSWKHSVFFAVNLVPPASGRHVLHVGDALTVLKRRTGPPGPPRAC